MESKKERVKKLTDHVVMEGDKMKCLHCDTKLQIPVPIGLNVFIAMMKAFLKDHKNCKPNVSST